MTTQDFSALSGKRVLVTGGTGFIGRRLVEALTTVCDAEVRVMARNFARAVGVARFPIELVHGDVSNAADVERAVQGCEIVFHGAAVAGVDPETARTVNVGGTENVMAAALRAGVERVVHISSLTVYGFPSDGDLDETAPRQYQGMNYADTKLDAERVALDYHRKHGLPVSIIQPACVYGPFGGAWTTGVLDQLKNDRVILVDGGQGLANPVYVDDVIQALLLAAIKQEAIGEAFLISDGQRVTWRQFYEQYARLVDGAEIVSAPAAELVAAHNRQVKQRRKKGLLREAWDILRQDAQLRKRIFTTREGSFAARAVKPLVPRSLRESFKANNKQAKSAQPKEHPKRRQPPAMSPLIVKFYTPQAYVRIDKAERLLGYQPTHTLETGLQLVERWARWARIL
jgi:nucleoside-diphosphate-sugar epimerase